MTSVMDRRAFIGALGLGALGGAACTRPAVVHASVNRDGIDYSPRGGYNALDFVALGGVYKTPASTTFRLGKIGQRWVFVEPNTNKVFMARGVYFISPDQPHILGGGQQAGRSLFTTVAAKYGANWGFRAPWAKRLREWHFNVGGQGQLLYPGTPFTVSYPLQVGTGAMLNSGGLIAEPVKNILHSCLDQRGFSAIGHFFHVRNHPDVFDPRYTAYTNASLANLSADPNVLYLQMDDTDNLHLFGTAHVNESGFMPRDANHGAHGGIIALMGRLNVSSSVNANNGPVVNWRSDTKNYTKAEIIADLTTKYGAIAALNAAWNTSNYYTTFGSAGGYGVGTGLTDEDGLRPRAWFGSNSPAFPGHPAGTNNFIDSTSWPAAVKIDMDLFLEKMTAQYLIPFRNKSRARWPGALTCGPTTFGSAGPPRQAILKGAAPYVDLASCGFGQAEDPTGAKTAYARRALGDKPMMQGIYIPCNVDSCLYYLPSVGDQAVATQAIKGALIAARINQGVTARDPNTGDYPWVVSLIWAHSDSIAENRGWGLISMNDNAYDGRDYRVARPDPYNPQYTIRTEDRVYGDAITPIKNANIAMFATIQSQFGR